MENWSTLASTDWLQQALCHVQTETDLRQSIHQLLQSAALPPQSLECPICKDVLRCPVRVVASQQACGHVFCSECVRKAFSQQKQRVNGKCKCPLCQMPIHDTLNFRDSLQPCPRLEVRACQYRAAVPYLKLDKEEGQDEEDGDNEMEETTEHQQVQEAIQKALHAAANLAAPPVGGNPMRPQRPRVYTNYKTLRKKQQLLHEAGLFYDSHDDEARLVDRHKRFVVFYNAHCDSLWPRADADILTEFNRHEQEASTSRKSKKRATSTTETTEMKSAFQQMVAQLKAKQAQGRRQRQESAPEEDKDGSMDRSTDTHSDNAKQDQDNEETTRTGTAQDICTTGNAVSTTTPAKENEACNDAAEEEPASGNKNEDTPSLTTTPLDMTTRTAPDMEMEKPPPLCLDGHTESTHTEPNITTAKTRNTGKNIQSKTKKIQAKLCLTGPSLATECGDATVVGTKRPAPETQPSHHGSSDDGINDNLHNDPEEEVQVLSGPPFQNQADTHTTNRKTKRRRRSSTKAPWYCASCTFLNVRLFVCCEMCSAKRPTNVAEAGVGVSSLT